MWFQYSLLLSNVVSIYSTDCPMWFQYTLLTVQCAFNIVYCCPMWFQYPLLTVQVWYQYPLWFIEPFFCSADGPTCTLTFIMLPGTVCLSSLTLYFYLLNLSLSQPERSLIGNLPFFICHVRQYSSKALNVWSFNGILPFSNQCQLVQADCNCNYFQLYTVIL